MIDLPFNPDALGDCALARYLNGHPSRTPVLQSILRMLDDDGRVGDKARYYVVRNNFRREVLRRTLGAFGIPSPTWLYESASAAEANRHFVAGYRDQYNLHQFKQRRQVVARSRPSHLLNPRN